MTAMDTTADQVREIEFETAPARFARGWHCIGLEQNPRDSRPAHRFSLGSTDAVEQARAALAPYQQRFGVPSE